MIFVIESKSRENSELIHASVTKARSLGNIRIFVIDPWTHKERGYFRESDIVVMTNPMDLSDAIGYSEMAVNSGSVTDSRYYHLVLDENARNFIDFPYKCSDDTDQLTLYLPQKYTVIAPDALRTMFTFCILWNYLLAYGVIRMVSSHPSFVLRDNDPGEGMNRASKSSGSRYNRKWPGVIQSIILFVMTWFSIITYLPSKVMNLVHAPRNNITDWARVPSDSIRETQYLKSALDLSGVHEILVSVVIIYTRRYAFVYAWKFIGYGIRSSIPMIMSLITENILVGMYCSQSVKLPSAFEHKVFSFFAFAVISYISQYMFPIQVLYTLFHALYRLLYVVGDEPKPVSERSADLKFRIPNSDQHK